MSPDQTAPKGAVWSGSILFAINAIKVHKQIREQTCYERGEWQGWGGGGGKAGYTYLAELLWTGGVGEGGGGGTVGYTYLAELFVHTIYSTSSV